MGVRLSLLTAVFLAALPRPARAGVCESLPRLSPAGEQVVSAAFPAVALDEVREVPRETLLGWLGEAAASRVSSVAVFSNDRWRESCRIYMSAENLAEADSLYVLALIPAVRGVTTKGKRFAMRALLSGRGEHLIRYDFEGKIVFKHPDLDNDKYILESRVTLKTPARGKLEFEGATFTHWFAGDYPIRSIVGDGKTLKVHAGSIVKETKETPLRPRRPKKKKKPEEPLWEDSGAGRLSIARDRADAFTENRF
jgi:hypothetical protein